MKTTKNVILFAVAVVFFAALNAEAWFDPTVGVFCSRDPIGEPGFESLRLENSISQDSKSSQLLAYNSMGDVSFLSSGINSDQDRKNLRDTLMLNYDFVRNNPITYIDYLGLENVQLVVTTEIRPPDYEVGTKTIHRVVVNDKGEIVPPVLTFVGATSIAHIPFTGFGSFEQSSSLYAPVVGASMRGNARSAVFVLAPIVDIDYFFVFTLNFCDRKGTLWGLHDSYPSYEVDVNGQNIVNFQQHELPLRVLNPLLLIGPGNIQESKEFKF